MDQDVARSFAFCDPTDLVGRRATEFGSIEVCQNAIP